jgi:ATP-dependent exoDNAse (exonuclease V) alpha subunit
MKSTDENINSKGAHKIEAPSKRRQKPKIMNWNKILILNNNFDGNSGWGVFNGMDIIHNFGAP